MKQGSILATIVQRKQEEVEALRRRGLPESITAGQPRGFIRALLDHGPVAIIAEAKKASPSKGLIRPDFDPVAIARAYHQGGASAVSVLTDVDFFQGSLEYIPMVRAAVPLPVLRKDFIIDTLQIEEASRYGADAILLIAAILDVAQLHEYRLQAEALGMDALVEVHDEEELHKAMAAESRLIGINNRNLKTFAVDLETTFRLQREIPIGIPMVSESGIATRDDMARLKAAGIAAALIGESLIRSTSQESLLKTLLSV